MAQAQRFGLKIRTRLAFDELDNVLGQYCQAGYSISIGGLDTTGTVRKKIMVLHFEKAEDRDRLKALFAARSGGAAAMRGAGPADTDTDEPAAA